MKNQLIQYSDWIMLIGPDKQNVVSTWMAQWKAGISAGQDSLLDTIGAMEKKQFAEIERIMMGLVLHMLRSLRVIQVKMFGR